MFLMELEEEEKKLFWTLAINMIMADGIISEEELNLLNQYQKEMGTSFKLERGYVLTTDDLSKDIESCSKRTKRVILFELLGLAYSDHEFAREEQDIIDKYAKISGVSPTECDEMKKCIDEVSKVYSRLAIVLNGDGA